MPIFNSDAISKSDLDHDVVRAVVEHYRHSEGKIRIASMQGALFVLKWQEAEKLSGEALMGAPTAGCGGTVLRLF